MQFAVPRYLILLSSALGLLAACRDAKVTEPAGVGAAITVSVSPTLEPAIRTQVTSYLGVGGVVPATGTAALPADTGRPSIVFALDQAEQPILAGYSTVGGGTVLDAQSSAVVLARLVLADTGTTTGALEAQIVALAGFPAFVDSVRMRAARRLPLLTTAANVQEAVAVTAPLRPVVDLPPDAKVSASVVASTSAPTASRPVFARYGYVIGERQAPLAIPRTDRRTVTVNNALLIPVKLTTPFGLVRIGAAEFCFFCLTNRGIQKESGSFEAPAEGAMNVTVQMDRELFLAQGVLDAGGKILEGLGKLGMDKTAVSQFVLTSNDVTLEAVAALIEGKSPLEATIVAAEYLLGEEYQTLLMSGVMRLNIPRVQKLPLLKSIRALSGFYSTLLKVDGWAVIAVKYPMAVRFWSNSPETAVWCVEDGRLYGGCGRRIEVTPTSVRVGVGSAPLAASAMVFDDAGRYLDERVVTWTSVDTGIVRVSSAPTRTPTTSETTLTFGRPGATAVRVRAGTAAFDLQVAVADVDSTAIYAQSVLGLWSVSLSGVSRRLEIRASGVGAYQVAPVPNGFGGVQCPGIYSPPSANGWCEYGMTWSIQKTTGRYYLMDGGFWNFSTNERRDPLTIGGSGFTTYTSTGAVSRVFTR
jgi:hypothetical protein